MSHSTDGYDKHVAHELDGISEADLETMRDVDAMLSEQRDDMRAAEQLDSAPGLELVASTLEKIWDSEHTPQDAEPPHTALTRLTRPLVALAAISLFGFVLWYLVPDTPDQTDTPILLGNDTFHLEVSTDSTTEFDELVWFHPRPSGLRFEVRVFDPTSSEPATPLALSPRLRELRWVDIEGTHLWPDTVIIDITALDATGRIVDVIRETVRRSP